MPSRSSHRPRALSSRSCRDAVGDFPVSCDIAGLFKDVVVRNVFAQGTLFARDVSLSQKCSCSGIGLIKAVAQWWGAIGVEARTAGWPRSAEALSPNGQLAVTVSNVRTWYFRQGQICRTPFLLEVATHEYIEMQEQEAGMSSEAGRRRLRILRSWHQSLQTI
jgi:hypothetical protein